MSSFNFYKADEEVEEYGDLTIDYIRREKEQILKAAGEVGRVEITNAIAGAMAEENAGYNATDSVLDQYALSALTWTDLAGITPVALTGGWTGATLSILNAATLMKITARSHEEWKYLFGTVEEDKKPEHYEKIINPVLIDVGKANIKIHTAIRLLTDASLEHEVRALRLMDYRNDYQQFVEHLVNDNVGLSAKIYALMMVEADRWFTAHNAYGSDWNSLPQAMKDALYITYSNIGKNGMEKAFAKSTNGQRLDYTPLPTAETGGGLDHLENAEVIADAIGSSNYENVELIDSIHDWPELAKQENEEGAAYREALLKLYPFVVKDGNYSDMAIDRKNFSDAYLRDRAEMLSWYIRLRYDSVSLDRLNTLTFDETDFSFLFDDVENNLKVRLGKNGYSYIGFGNDLANTIAGGEGNDCLYGMAGGDTLSGGDGNDYLEGGKGQDNLFGGNNDDTFFVMGKDTAYDVFDGGDGIDTIKGSAGDDTIRVNQLLGLHSIERIIGGGGEDVIAGTDLGDAIDLTSVVEITGIARIEGGGREDTIKGSGTADVIYGGSRETPEDSASDRLEGGAGNDTYHVGRGDIVNDSDGQGSLWYDGRQLSPLIFTRLAQSDIYFDETADTAAIIDRATGTLTLFSGDDLEISLENFTSGSLGIILQDEKNDEHSYTWNVAGSSLTDVISPGVFEVDGIDGWGFERRIWDDHNSNLRCDDDEELIDFSRKLLHAETDTFLITGSSGNDYLQGFKGYDHLTGGEGDDILAGWGVWPYSNPAFSDTGNFLDGGPGNDSLWGAAGPDHMIGGQDDDVLSGVLGRDILRGDDGNDVLAGGSDSDLLAGGEGQDVLLGDAVLYTDTAYVMVGSSYGISFAYFANGAISSCTPVNFSVSPYESGLLPSEVKAGNDILDGGGGKDYLYGGGGNDILKGGAGQDTLIGGAGEDRLWGDDGNDVLVGDDPGDEAGDGGNDHLYGGAGNDELQGQGGNDTLSGDAGSDRLFGGSGFDDLDGGAGDDELSGEEGDDILSGGDGRDTLWGDAGNDVLLGGNDADMLFGGAGDDILTGGAGNDTLDGGPGNDRYVLHGGSGIDRISDTAGANALMFDENAEMEVTFGVVSASGMVTFNPASHDLVIRYGESDVVIIENGRSGGFDFRIGSISYEYAAFLNHVPHFQEYGSGSKKITGSTGNDRIYAGDGNDTVHGGEGNDSITGGVGFDPTFREFLRKIEFLEKNGIQASGLSYGGNTSERHYRDIIHGDAGNDALSGGWGDDQLYGGNGDDALHGGRDNDYLQGDTGNDILDGDVGYDTLSGGSGDDILYGGAGNDTLSGDAGNDKLYGGAGNDTFSGGTGNDILAGGDGDDCFYGDAGADTIDGGAGRDRIDYSGSSAGIQVNLKSGFGAGGDAEGDVYMNIEEALGTSFSDALIGNEEDNLLWGSGWSEFYGEIDTIRGEGGCDEIYGVGLLEGGAGNDTVHGSGQLFGGEGDDELEALSQWSYRTRNELDGGAGNDILTGHNGHDLLRGGDGDDRLDGGGTSAEYGYEPRSFDLMEGGAGNDTYLCMNNYDFSCGGIDFVSDTQGVNMIRMFSARWEEVNPWQIEYKLISVDLGRLDMAMSYTGTWYDEEENSRLDGFTATILNDEEPDMQTARDLLIRYESMAVVIIGGGRDLGYTFVFGDDKYSLSHQDVLGRLSSSANFLPKVESEQIYELPASCQLFGKIDATDLDNDTLQYSIKEKPVGGDLALETDGRWIYTARENFIGRDNAIIDIDDGHGEFVPVFLTFNVGVTPPSSGNTQPQGWQGFLSDALAAAVSAGSLEFYGTDDSEQLIGSAGNDILMGLAGYDVLIGGPGNDFLVGGEGRDVFVFDNEPDENCNLDGIADFVPGSDKIQLDSVIFSKLTETGVLSDAYFRSGAAGMAEDEDDYILYNTTSGALLYDADGSGHGVAIEIASLINTPAITAGDFLVVN